MKLIVSFKNKSSVEEFIGTHVQQAFIELKEEFAANGIKATVDTSGLPAKIEIKISYNLVNDFVYG